MVVKAESDLIMVANDREVNTTIELVDIKFDFIPII